MIWKEHDLCKNLQKTRKQTNSFMTVTVDGGPDENLWFSKNIGSTIEYFCEHDLDAYFLATNAPGSTFNRVDWRLPLFKSEMTGVILPTWLFWYTLGQQKPNCQPSFGAPGLRVWRWGSIRIIVQSFYWRISSCSWIYKKELPEITVTKSQEGKQFMCENHNICSRSCTD